MSHLGLIVLHLFLSILNVLLHTLGLYLLLTIYKNGKNETPQQLFLIHLTVCEILINFFGILRGVDDIISESTNCGEIDSLLVNVNEYVMILSFTGVSVVYYITMIYLTVDRLADILLNIKYHLYWDTRRTNVLMCITWIAGLLLSGIISLLYKFTGFEWENVFYKYFLPILNFSFITISLVTYVCIFRIYKRTHDTKWGQRGTRRALSSWQVFRRSRFYVSVLMILTFLVFMVIPDLSYLFLVVIRGDKTRDFLLLCCYISYGICNIIDAWIYIYLQAPVRRLLIRKLHLTAGDTYFFNKKTSTYKNIAIITTDL